MAVVVLGHGGGGQLLVAVGCVAEAEKPGHFRPLRVGQLAQGVQLRLVVLVEGMPGV